MTSESDRLIVTPVTSPILAEQPLHGGDSPFNARIQTAEAAAALGQRTNPAPFFRERREHGCIMDFTVSMGGELGVVGARLPHVVEEGAEDQVPERHHGGAALPGRNLISRG